ncbi:hypothetical protein KABACHOK_01220 [Brevundimonas phage vB_BpoS-Kabachok]|uniref:Uncharacterized protein n=1 Tax=Brevundimonas phage vB_BpoS-Kabachok TaxID=2948600 RepID=A0A9E7SJ43_9CAUD|nr:hypothetical protein KABACHOK_01220 [Brevundimonas phage vB_BpoS-Kabachok]
MTEAYDPASGAVQKPAILLDPDAKAHLQSLSERLVKGADRAIDRDLHALLYPQASDRTPVPRYTASVDSIVRLIEAILPQWVHGYCTMPGAGDDGATEVRAWVAGPGYITDDHTDDYFHVDASGSASGLTLALMACLACDGRRA